MACKKLILYHFFQKDEIYIKNFCHFLQFGYEEENEYIIIISGFYDIDLPTAPNIRYIFTENKNNDYGGYCKAISELDGILDFDHIFFINSSVRGPYLPPSNGEIKSWTEKFTDRFNDDIGIVGSTINILPANSPITPIYRKAFTESKQLSHVQTTAYTLKKDTLVKLIKSGFFDEKPNLSKEDVIARYEVRLSQLILSFGLNLKCMLPEYNSIDYRIKHNEINPTSANGDVIAQNAYFGRTIHPYECIFIKTNRGLHNEMYLDRLAISNMANVKKYNPLQSVELEKYRNQLVAGSISKERINLQTTSYTANQIMNLTIQLVKKHPESKSEIIKILNSMNDTN